MNGEAGTTGFQPQRGEPIPRSRQILRVLAEQVEDAESRKLLLTVAEEYEGMAEFATRN